MIYLLTSCNTEERIAQNNLPSYNDCINKIYNENSSFVVQNLRTAFTKAGFILVLVIPLLFYEWVALKKAVQLKRFRLAFISSYR